MEWEGRTGGEGRCDKVAAFFYVDDGLVTLTYPVWLQGVFTTMARLFGRVALQKKNGKTVGTICCPCRAVGTQYEALYERRMTGEGLPYQERHKVIVQCPECGKEMEAGYMEVHRKT